MRCPKCDAESVPYVETRFDVRADRVTLVGSGGGRQMSRGGVEEVASHAPAPMSEPSEPLTDDDIPF